MALSTEQWLQTHFFPVVESLPAPGDADPTSPMTAVAVIAAMRLQGALDALVAIGALDAEQEARCRRALEPKGITTTTATEVRSQMVGFMGTLTAARDRGNEAEPEQPDRLLKVLGSGQVFGLVEGEEAVLVAIEIWERTVHAEFLIAVDPAGADARAERGRQLRDWLERKRAGELTDADRPPMAMGLTHPGAATTWLLEVGDRSIEGHVEAGQGGGEWWRLRVQWVVAVGDGVGLVISARENGRTVGRAEVHA